MNSRGIFVKTPKVFKQTMAYGPQVIASEGQEWKRYRKMCAPAFGEVGNHYLLASLW